MDAGGIRKGRKVPSRLRLCSGETPFHRCGSATTTLPDRVAWSMGMPYFSSFFIIFHRAHSTSEDHLEGLACKGAQ